MASRTLICCPFPNPNGNIHLGHLAGPFLSADIQRRYRKLLGHEVFMLGGTDDYQSWTASMAERMGDDPAAMAAANNAAIRESCRVAKVEMSHFHQPSTSPYTEEATKNLVEQLVTAGHIVAREVTAYYCESCERYLYDVYINGECPACGVEACGASCEGCGRPHDASDLIDPVCLCGKKPIQRRVEKLFFPLEPHRAWLEEYYDTTLATNVYQISLFRKLVEGGLPDLPASQLTDWGVPLSFLKGFEDQRFSPWLQMTADHLAATRTLAENAGGGDWSDFLAEENTEVVHFCGPDTGWIFGIMYPAVHRAFAEAYRPGVGLFVSQWYNLEDSVFSTSKQHAIWVSDLVNKTSADVVRFHCASTSPEVESRAFRGQEFHDTVHLELIGRWEGWLGDLATRVRDCGGTAPERFSGAGEAFFSELETLSGSARSAYDIASYSPQKATRVACELIRAAHNFGKTSDHLKEVASADLEWRGTVASQLAAARMLAIVTEPLMPDFSSWLWKTLGLAGEERTWDGDRPRFLPAGQSVGNLGAPYFPRFSETSFHG